MERDAWHRFTRRVAEPFDRLSRSHEAWLGCLVDYFDRGSSWQKLEGAEELLTLLKAKGYRLAVLSNWHGILDEILRFQGISDLVDVVLTSSRVGRKKPHPLMFRSALEQLEVAESAVIHVGDSLEEDVAGALGVGIRPIYLQREERCLETAPAVPVIRSMNELWNVIESVSGTKSEKDPNR
jgi:HAD superfamily hydrolase (TIGR01549 family)